VGDWCHHHLSLPPGAGEVVDELSRSAAIEQKKLQEAQIAADKSMDMITKTLAEATERRSEVGELKTDVAEKEKATLERKEQIETELSSITPVLEASKASVCFVSSWHMCRATT
jgi:hypothetical protein